jgi:hypothetical protein
MKKTPTRRKVKFCTALLICPNWRKKDWAQQSRQNISGGV